jgi:hypothetical protein
MPNHVSRRERRRRLYYLRAVIGRMAAVTGPDHDFAAAFAVDRATLDRWLQEREAAPAWIPQLATQAYRVPPPPPKPSRIPLLVGILVGVVLLGAAAVFWLGR